MKSLWRMLHTVISFENMNQEFSLKILSNFFNVRIEAATYFNDI